MFLSSTFSHQFLNVSTSSSPIVYGLTNEDRSNSGYVHGCNDAKASGDSSKYPYLDRNGGPSAHTAIYMKGYNTGYRNCLNSFSNFNNTTSIIYTPPQKSLDNKSIGEDIKNVSLERGPLKSINRTGFSVLSTIPLGFGFPSSVTMNPKTNIIYAAVQQVNPPPSYFYKE